ncbi:hypothetical protein PpBr36_09119 [Pyricularia pennisetigena]|uniref:hypothetical protein n=1 Tax=Pyricularia pennisetigena TaxID=1578925 RepID=UPI0011527A88|nr:hypothetical protein PpBr36_09119 [Pyricularia pennisetigena]TLS24758.1 hypothetical protein PpBr36_09119 [Pyricularia pennisetigena]
MRFSIACTIAVLLQTAFAAPFDTTKIGNIDTPGGLVRSSAYPDGGVSVQGVEAHGPHIRSKRGNGSSSTGRKCRQCTARGTSSVQKACADASKKIRMWCNGITAEAQKANAEMTKQVKNAGVTLDTVGKKVNADVRRIGH